MSRIKISKPERLPREGVSDVDLHTWKNELLNYLSQDDVFEKFCDDGPYSSWEAAESNKQRLSSAVEPDSEQDLLKRRKQLNNFITITAGCCYKDHYMTIIEQSTSFNWIWNELKNIYQIVHVGKDFLNIVDIKFDANSMSATTVYNAYRSKIMENLKPKGTTVKWKSSMVLQSSEVLTPTFEDHILLSVLQLIDIRLPLKVREIYGPRMEDSKFLMDFKQDILSNIPKMLEDLESIETQLNWMQIGKTKRDQFKKSKHDRSNRNTQFKSTGNKFCRLCHLARKPRDQVTSHEIGDVQCPSLSSRDRMALEQKIGRLAPVVTEGDDLEALAVLHGYGEGVDSDQQVDQESQGNVVTNTVLSYISPVPSQILTLFQNNKIVHIDLDSGCWVSCVKLQFAKEMNWKIYPNSQLARLADDKTILKSVGEINEILTRNNWTVNYRALVMLDLHTNAIGGNNFIKENKINQSFVNKTITVHDKYVIPETNRFVKLPTHTNSILVSAAMPEFLLNNQTITIAVPIEDGNQVIVEPRVENSNKSWPIPQLCQVRNGAIEINNSSDKPMQFKSKQHRFQLVSTKEQATISKPDSNYQKHDNQAATPTLNIEDLNVNFKVLNESQKLKLLQSIEKNKKIFDKDLSLGYNHASGKHFCNLNWANNEKPISRKVICPNYNSDLNYLLQEVCDQLTTAGVLGVPQEDDIIIQHVSPCFLRKKQKAKNKTPSQLTSTDVRLVVNTTELSKYLKNIPTKVTKPNEVYAALSKWKYIIKSDLYQGFFQNNLHPTAYPWCAIQTPYGGIRYFKRSIQGLVGQTEEQDELLAKILHIHLKEGRCVKIADDIFVGGSSVDEAIDNWCRIMETLHNNNLKISPEKTIMFPEKVDILSWQWKQGGYLSPSPHRKLALENIKYEDLKTVKDIRSWLGLYKTFIDCTPNLTMLLDKFDQFVGSRDSKDSVTWTEDFIQSFKHAQEHIKNMKDLYLPTKHDQLIIMCDGARTPPAVGMVLQAKTPNGDIKIVKYYSVKLKPHMVKWYPCELEAVALGSSIEAFYEFIKQSIKPIIICPDSKPVVDAAKKIEKGQFSLSPRIQTFLNGLSKIKYEIQHISGKSGHNMAGDFQSRNAANCDTEHCQICKFIHETADSIIDVKLSTISPTDTDHSMMSFLNRQAWKNIQDKDAACRQATNCLQSGQTPSKKSGKLHNNIRKYVSKATVAKDGLLVVHGIIPMTTNKTERIVIPADFVEAIVTQVHLKFQHPAKSQLMSILNRYFFANGIHGAVDNLYSSCQLCQAAMKIPKVLNEFHNTTTATHPGTHFGIDIMRRAKQKIVVARDMFSSFVTAMFIDREDADSMRNAIVQLISPIRVKEQVIVRTDNATGFQALARNDKKLSTLQITIELSDPHNKNGNSCVDKAISELINEITKLIPIEVPIDICSLAKAVNNLNSRIRRRGNLSASEILFCRDQITNNNLHIKDEIIADDQQMVRDKANSKHNEQIKSNSPVIKKGNLVQRNENPKKHMLRETFLVTDIQDQNLKAQKLTNVFSSSKKSQLRSKEYVFKQKTVHKVSDASLSKNYEVSYNKRNYKQYDEVPQWSAIRKSTSQSSLDTISDDYEFPETTNNNIVNNEISSEVSDSFQLVQNESPVENNIEIQEVQEPELDTETHDINIEHEENHEADDDTDTPTGCISKRKFVKRKVREHWSVDKPLNYRLPRRARTECLKKLSNRRLSISPHNIPEVSSETLRDGNPLHLSVDAVASIEINSARIMLNTSDSEIEEPLDVGDWDQNDVSGTPSYFDNAFCGPLTNFPEFTPAELPERVVPGRVYNLSKIPPLGSLNPNKPLSLTSYQEIIEPGRVYDLSHLASPPSLQNNKHSTPKKYTKSLGKSKLARIRKTLFKH